MDWIKIWTFFFFLSLAIFAGLSIVVAIGGLFNIRSLFKDLMAARHKAEHTPPGDEGTPSLRDGNPRDDELVL